MHSRGGGGGGHLAAAETGWRKVMSTVCSREDEEGILDRRILRDNLSMWGSPSYWRAESSRDPPPPMSYLFPAPTNIKYIKSPA